MLYGAGQSSRKLIAETLTYLDDNGCEVCKGISSPRSVLIYNRIFFGNRMLTLALLST